MRKEGGFIYSINAITLFSCCLDILALLNNMWLNFYIPNIIGLKLKQKDRGLPFRAYNYTPAITYEAELTGTDWHLLSLYDMVGDHVRIHELKEGEDLLQCVKGYQRDEARAVIVINTTEDNTLPPDVALPLKAINNFLVGVVPQSVGSDLLECLQELFHDDELYAR